jgi:hypothetical protein
MLSMRPALSIQTHLFPPKKPSKVATDRYACWLMSLCGATPAQRHGATSAVPDCMVFESALSRRSGAFAWPRHVVHNRFMATNLIDALPTVTV